MLGARLKFVINSSETALRVMASNHRLSIDALSFISFCSSCLSQSLAFSSSLLSFSMVRFAPSAELKLYSVIKKTVLVGVGVWVVNSNREVFRSYSITVTVHCTFIDYLDQAIIGQYRMSNNRLSNKFTKQQPVALEMYLAVFVWNVGGCGRLAVFFSKNALCVSLIGTIISCRALTTKWRHISVGSYL